MSILVVGAFSSTYTPTVPATTISHSEAKEDAKTPSIDAAPALPQQPNEDIIIYRWGGTSLGYLVPRQCDVASGSLSFSAMPKPGAAMATISAINATGILVADHAKPTHVSVRPRFASVRDWFVSGRTSIWTRVLYSILIKYMGR